MDLKQALKYFGFSKKPSISELKQAYRRASKILHPDNQETGSHKAFLELQAYYDYLINYTETQDFSWLSEQSQNLENWKETFQKSFKFAHFRSQRSTNIAAGLEYLRTIQNFSRSYIYPPKEWFYGAIYGSAANYTPDDYLGIKDKHREHLERIAPNPKLKESWSKRYFELEFNQPWIFYLPGTIEQLRFPWKQAFLKEAIADG